MVSSITIFVFSAGEMLETYFSVFSFLTVGSSQRNSFRFLSFSNALL